MHTKALSPKYKDFELGVGYRLDLLVENSIIIEIKSVDEMKPVFSKQLLTYLKICNLRYGILVKFNTDFLKTSIKRIFNGY